MDSLSIICTVVGILVVVYRAPLVFAPSATLRFYDRAFLSTNTKLRGLIGVVALPLVTAFILLPFGERDLVVLLRVSGWCVAAMSLLIFVSPDRFRRFVRAKNSFFENAVPTHVLRVLGALAALVGVALIYIGAYVI